MHRVLTVFASIVLLAAVTHGAAAQDTSLSFFITSAGPGNGADLNGLEGADRQCAALAASVGAGQKEWRAYLSTGEVNARDRIGSGPWFNATGVMVAESVDQLHSDANRLTKENSLTEAGAVVNGRGDSPNMHDILTGSQLDGTAFASDADTTCENWTSSAANGSAQVGHHDRTGGGPNPTSWNSAHGSNGCGQADLQSTGGNGLFYCFART